MTAAEAQAALDRRAALAAIAGAALGELPLLWLIRAALEGYEDMLSELPSSIRASLRPIKLLTAGGHTFELTPDNDSRIVVERDSFGSSVRAHETPNAALVLYDAIKGAPVQAEALLIQIESVTRKDSR